MAKYTKGDHVSWNSEAEQASGRIIKLHERDFDYKGHRHHASKEAPQYEIASDKIDHIAAHKEHAEKGRLMAAAFTTIGHSNRSLEEFLDMLRDAQVGLLVDVRSFPKSRNNPVFNIDRLPSDLAKLQIGYQHCPALGGRRPKQSGVDEGLNALWRVQSFHNYADYALGDTFGVALDTIVRLGGERRLAMMCSEAVWWRCHRRIITDYLLLNGHAVDHLMGPGQTQQAKPTPGAERTELGKVIYP